VAGAWWRSTWAAARWSGPSMRASPERAAWPRWCVCY
jgi:hypothetical protein